MDLFNLFNKKKNRHDSREAKRVTPEAEPKPSTHYERLALFSPGLSHRIEVTESWYLAKRKITDIEVVRVTTSTESKLVIMPKYPVDKKYKELFDEDLDWLIKNAFNGSVPQSLDEIERIYKKYMWIPATLIRY